MTVFIVLPETLRCQALTIYSQHGSSHHNTTDFKRNSSYKPILPDTHSHTSASLSTASASQVFVIRPA